MDPKAENENSRILVGFERRLLDILTGPSNSTFDIKQIAASEGVSIATAITAAKKVYASLFFAMAKKKEINNDQRLALDAIARRMQISIGESVRIEGECLERLYGDELRKALEDGPLTNEEETMLTRMRKDLRIANDLAKKIVPPVVLQSYAAFFRGIFSDGILTVSKVTQLRNFRMRMGIEMSELDKKTLEDSISILSQAFYFHLQDGDLTVQQEADIEAFAIGLGLESIFEFC